MNRAARLPALLALALLASGAGCASLHARQRSERLARALDGVRYPQPADEVWDAVRRLLADRGYPLASADARAIGAPEPGLAGRLFSAARETRPLGEDAGLLQRLGIVGRGAGAPQGRTLETGWRRSADRYRADALEGPDGVRVVLTRYVNDGVERLGRPERDPALELELARRLAPDAAAAAEAAAAR